mgnify:CR=1 FL=1
MWNNSIYKCTYRKMTILLINIIVKCGVKYQETYAHESNIKKIITLKTVILMLCILSNNKFETNEISFILLSKLKHTVKNKLQ